MLTYSNTNCLGNALTYISPTKFNAKAVNNNCLTLNGTTDYIYFGEDNILGDVKKVSFYINGITALTSDCYVFSNMLSKSVYGNSLSLQPGNLTLRIRYESFQGDSSEAYSILTNGRSHKVVVEIIDNTPVLTIDNINYALTVAANAVTSISTYIGCIDFSGIDGFFKGSIFDFKCYDSNDNLIHHYPMAEGSNDIIYDAVGTITGELTTASIYTCWETKQNIYAYNLVEGFGKIIGSDAKIPLTSIINMYNSDFSSSVDGWSGYGAGYTLSYSNNILSSSRIDVDSTRAYNYIQHSYSGLTDLSKELKFRIKATIKNTSLTENLTGICIAIGRLDPRQITGLAYILLTGLAISPNETYNLDTDLLQGTGIDILNNIGIGVIFNAVATPTNALSFEISNIEITRNNYTEEHPKLEYGHNMCESILDFSQGVTNVAEITQVTSTDLTAYTPSIAYTSGSSLAPFYKHNNNVDNVKFGESNYLIYTKKLEDVNAVRVKSKLRNPNSNIWLNTTLEAPTVSTAPTIPNFNLATFALPLSFGYWVKFDNGIPSIFFGKWGMGNPSSTGFRQYSGLTSVYFISTYLRAVPSGTLYSTSIGLPTDFYSDGKWHSIVVSIAASGGRLKVYLDGVYKSQSAIHDITSLPFSGLFSLQSEGNSFAKPFICNFDMSDVAAPYTIADYQSNKIIPSSLLNATTGNRFLLALNNKVNGTTNTWIDESIGSNNMTLAGTYTIKDTL